MGKKLTRRVAAIVVGATAAVGVAGAGVASATQPSPAPARPFIEVRDVVTNVGQHPKLVVRYGNRGGTTLKHVYYSCFPVASDGSVQYRQLNYNTYRSPLLPGQSANLEFEGTARRVGHGTRVKCMISGVEEGTNRLRVAFSNVATIHVDR